MLVRHSLLLILYLLSTSEARQPVLLSPSSRFTPITLFFFLLTLCIFSTPTDDETAVHSLEKRSQSKFCKNRVRCCLWKWTYLGLSINTLLWGPVSSLQNALRWHSELRLSGLLAWPSPKAVSGQGTPRGSHFCCYSNLTLIYFQEINIGFSSVYYLHAVTAQTASVCVHWSR